MKLILLRNTLAFSSIIFCCTPAMAQQPLIQEDNGKKKTIAAGAQYKRSPFYQFFWGRNYRDAWAKPVSFPVLQLDTLRGGLLSYKEGGSNQSKSLHLTLAGEKEYALRSVDKSLSKVIPKIFHNTFLADIVNDEISMSHPYGALGVPIMADAIKVKHSNPEYFYLPEQKALDSLNKKYAGKVYLLEQRPKGNWKEADNFGNFEKFADTDEMLEDIFKSSSYSVDQPAFARARLFDMLIADFDRHADQWKWGVTKWGGQTLYEPIPTDRDQAFFKHNGVLLNAVIAASGMKFLQSYDEEINSVEAYSYVNRLLDRLLTNKMTASQWQAIAVEMQKLLTDNVIESSVKQLPPEIFAIDGEKIIAKMKARRVHLAEYAQKYYLLIAKESEVVGTKGSEYFEVNHLANATSVSVFAVNEQGMKKDTPFYNRSFPATETKEIRLYGLSGNDVYKVTGKPNKKITLRIIGGDQRDSLLNESTGRGEHRVQVYDNKNNYFGKSSHTKLHLSEDTAVHVYNYNSFLPDKRGLSPRLGFNNDDRFYAGIRYGILDRKWRKLPFAAKHSFDLDYSISQKDFSATYNGLFPKLLAHKWDLVARANYDRVKWLNFYGIGNETGQDLTEINYYRMRTEELSANLGLVRRINNSNFSIKTLYRKVKILRDEERFIAKSLSPATPGLYDDDSYGTLQLGYVTENVNDSVLPQKGYTLSLNAGHTQHLNKPEKSFQTYSGVVQFFLPLVPRISLAVKNGITAISGDPVFYQYPSIGEAYNLRGFRRERFSGKTAFYNNTELRYIKNVRSYIFNGKAGLMGFIDNGRVWVPGEKSDKIHTSYGGGILLAPFNLVSAAVTYAVSKEQKMLQIRVGVLF